MTWRQSHPKHNGKITGLAQCYAFKRVFERIVSEQVAALERDIITATNRGPDARLAAPPLAH